MIYKYLKKTSGTNLNSPDIKREISIHNVGLVSGTPIRLVQTQGLCLYCRTVSNFSDSAIKSDRYGTLPVAANQLLRVMELKQLAKKLGFSQIKPENKQHIVLETPMEKPAWNL